MTQEEANNQENDTKGSIKHFLEIETTIVHKNWECNSCGFQEYTDAVSQEALDQWLQCSNCGESEFHLDFPKQ
jgi:transcription elongation factor Elf1